ncbi:unnamed protein product [Pylaiella littoralis]
MSRFLDYGVFVPSPTTNKDADSAPTATGQWARVGGKWLKVGPDGKPAVPPPSFSKTAPVTRSAQGGGRGGEGDGEDPGGSEDAELSSQTVDGVVNGSGRSSTSWEQRNLSKDSSEKGSLPMMTNGRDIYRELDDEGHTDDDGDDNDDDDGDDDDKKKGNGDKDDDDDHNKTPTIPITRSSSSVAGSAAPRPTSLASRSSRGGGVFNSNNSGLSGGDGISDGDDGGEGSAFARGSLTVAASGGVEGDAAAARNKMLTPGLSRSYSTDEIVGKFFGGDPGAISAAGVMTPKGAAERSSNDNGAAIAFVSSGEFHADFGAEAACVGERAAAPNADGAGKGGKGGSGKKSRKSTSPVAEPVKPVETRDVACQWDGSEMGDDEEEEEFVEVELPDTPDCRALTAVLRLYDHARLENKRTGVLSSRPGWGLEESIENWDGVYLDTEDRVVALDVDGDPENRQAVLIGPLPVELSGMDHLEQLTMRRHRFKGRIPAEFGLLSRLTHLNLSNCRLIGSIPPSFGDLVNLVVLNLSWNFLGGDLPPELGRLSKLEELLLNSNAFSAGTIPPEFGKLKKLQRLNLGHNIGISGTLPPEMCRMSSLEVMDLRHNKITGKIPPLFGRLTNLQQLWLQDNQLSDDIPAELARLPRLQMLQVTKNKLSGVIPMAIRGHPRYRAFKILAGNVALGERVAPNEKEIEAAARRKPSVNAMEHASAAHAQSQKLSRDVQQRRDSNSVSPRPGSYSGPSPVNSDRRDSTGLRSVSEGTCFEFLLLFLTNNVGRSSLGRKLRGMKRVMGKKATPPTSPSGSVGTTSSAGGGGKSPRAGGVGSYSAVLGYRRSGSELGGDEGEESGEGFNGIESGSAGVGVVGTLARGKAFLEGMDESGSATGDASPDPTASTDTGTSGYTSPSSQKSTGGGGGDGGVLGGEGGEAVEGGRNNTEALPFNAA